jgi:DNA replication protein DnaC
MRNEESWNSKSKANIMRMHFSPRLIKELNKFKTPAFGEIENTFIFGETGTGKTIRAAYMFLEYLKRQWLAAETIKGIFVSFPFILKEIEDTFEDKKKSKSQIMDKYATTPFLVIDDFMTRKPTDWVYDVFYYIINQRYEHLLPNIITSNHDLESLSNLLEDDRITSRIARMCKIEHKIANY